jgi:hypothetical protein
MFKTGQAYFNPGLNKSARRVSTGQLHIHQGSARTIIIRYTLCTHIEVLDYASDLGFLGSVILAAFQFTSRRSEYTASMGPMYYIQVTPHFIFGTKATLTKEYVDIIERKAKCRLH